MANITDVKLPDNSQYDLKDNVSGYASKVLSATTDDLAKLTATGDLADSGKKLSDLVLKSDVKDVLNSTSTTDPLSANQGKALADNIAANENVYGAKNLWDIEDWFNKYGQAFSKAGDIYSFTTSADLNSNVFKFADTDISVILSGVVTHSASDFRVDLLDISNNVVGSLNSYTSSVMGSGCKIRFYNPYIGQAVTIDSPMLRDARILDPTFAPFAETNLQLTQNKAERADLSTIHATGSTNTTGAQIDAGTFFYLNGQFCKALTNIAVNATFTANTNYKKDTVNGAIADLHKNQIAVNTSVDISSYTSTSNAFEVPADGYAVLNAQTTPSGISSLTIYGSEISTSTNFVVSLINPTGNYQGTGIFVRKGMHVVCSILQAGHAAIFDPLT